MKIKDFVDVVIQEGFYTFCSLCFCFFTCLFVGIFRCRKLNLVFSRIWSISYLLHTLSCSFPRNKTLRHADGRRHSLLCIWQQAELQHKNTHWFAISHEKVIIKYLKMTLYLSKVRHPVRFALWNHVIWCDQVDQVEATVEQQTIQAFGEIFVQHVAVG